ncbi:hypothetical protein KO516_02995 [Citreicella sp. C3M06]|uniref:hypothetical protein n=1 Tax=Citreicella sp. C3M06 TaxID=2841564 RepID=UPI001C08079E|nr:hypothetical protein [Citreicella sp. C3M06]MBU2959808.1 hypothetical protein [Citreicella sp. C3M06]
MLFKDRLPAIIAQVQLAQLHCEKFEIAHVSRVGVPAQRVPTEEGPKAKVGQAQ